MGQENGVCQLPNGNTNIKLTYVKKKNQENREMKRIVGRGEVVGK